MSKKSGVEKWAGRLKSYGYINPDDKGDSGCAPRAAVDDGGRGKQPKEERDDSKVTDHEPRPQAREDKPRAG